MARIRSLKPDIWLSPQVMNLPVEARLLFIGLITQADDKGRGTADPRRLKAAVFPGDDVSVSQVADWLDKIATQRLAVLYENDMHGRLFALPTWGRHQSISKPKESPYPPPLTSLPDESGTSPGLFHDESRGNGGEGNGEEGKGRERTDESVLGLDSAAWSRWQSYRTEIRKPLKPASIPAAQRALAAYGENQAAVVEQSIANGWQGLFELKRGAGVRVRAKSVAELEAEEAARAGVRPS
jgi:hypothetical protein